MNTGYNLASSVVTLTFLLAGCATQTSNQPSNDVAAAQPGAPSTQQRPVTEAVASRSVSGMRDSDPAASKRSVFYAFDAYDIKAEERPVIEANATYLRAHPELKVRIEGNADERGSSEYNLALGQRRAEGVMKIMGLLGVPEGRIETVSYGKEKPKATGHDEDSWRQNRRSDIVYP